MDVQSTLCCLIVIVQFSLLYRLYILDQKTDGLVQLATAKTPDEICANRENSPDFSIYFQYHKTHIVDLLCY